MKFSTCMRAMNKKKQLLYRRNCSKRNIGINERHEYFAVVMWLFLYFAGWWGAFIKTTLSSLLSCWCEDCWSSPWDPPFSALTGPTAIKYIPFYVILIFSFSLKLNNLKYNLNEKFINIFSLHQFSINNFKNIFYPVSIM